MLHNIYSQISIVTEVMLDLIKILLQEVLDPAGSGTNQVRGNGQCFLKKNFITDTQ